MTDLAEVVALLDLDQLEPELFRGQHSEARPPFAFGGQILAQALRAAGFSVAPDRLPHSLHCYFLGRGSATLPTFFQVKRLRDGGILSVRRVTALQDGQVIFEMTASFIIDIGYETEMRVEFDALEPARLPTLRDRLATYVDEMNGWWGREQPFDIRPVDAPPRTVSDEPGESKPRLSQMWLRATGEVPRDPHVQRCLLAYASGLNLLEPLLVPHSQTTRGPESVTSLDHAMWFHRTPELADWLLFEAVVRGESHRQGLCGGRFVTADGLLVATTDGLLGSITDQEGY